MNREQILEVYHQDPEAVVSLVLGIVGAYEQRIQAIEVQVRDLESRTKKLQKQPCATFDVRISKAEI